MRSGKRWLLRTVRGGQRLLRRCTRLATLAARISSRGFIFGLFVGIFELAPSLSLALRDQFGNAVT